MATTALTIALLFAGLGLATALLVAVHDAVEAWSQRRAAGAAHGVAQDGGGEGGLPLPSYLPRRVGRRSRPATLQVLSKQITLTEQNPRPAWFENAQRDIAHR